MRRLWKMSNKVKQTTRKFYNKWNYKISMLQKGVSSLRYRTPIEAADEAEHPDLKSVCLSLSTLDQSAYCKRIENHILDIYTNDKFIFDLLHQRHSNIIRTAFAPAEGIEDLLSDSHSVVVKKLPHNRYRYKVFLQPHKIADAQEKHRFIDWLDTQGSRVNITETVKQWFYKTHWNWDRRYMYVEDDQTLLLLKLKNADALGTVYTFRISDK